MAADATGVICDDLFVTMQVVCKDGASRSVRRALATDPREFTREQHFQRKVRTLTGLVQLCLWTPEILNPWRNAIWVDFVIHKLTRVLLPYLGLVAAAAGVALAVRLAGTAALWAAAIAGTGAAVVVALRPSVARQVGWAAKLSTAPLLAVANALRGRWGVWHTAADPRPLVAHQP